MVTFLQFILRELSSNFSQKVYTRLLGVLLSAPPDNTIKGKRDRAILAVAAYHGVRRFEITNLCIKDKHMREGVMHVHIRGKGT